MQNFAQHIHRLYEQGATDKRIGEYVTRWMGWVRGGVGSVVVFIQGLTMQSHTDFLTYFPVLERYAFICNINV